MEQRRQGDGVEDDGDVGGPGEADDVEVLVERPVDGDRDEGDDGSGEHGDEGFAGGVEGSGVDGLCRPESKRDGEDGEVAGGGGGVGGAKVTATKDDIDGREGKGDHRCGAEEGEGDEA